MKRIVLGVLLLAHAHAYAQEAVFGIEYPTTEPGADLCRDVSISGTNYFRMTATDSEGNESAFSNEVQKTDPAQVCWQNPTENIDGTPLTDLVGVTLYYSAEPITGGGTRAVVPLATLPVTLTGTAPQSASQSVSVDYLAGGDLTLTLTVNDADIADEGRLTVGTWSTPLFGDQTGPDQADHELTYTIPASVIDGCQIPITFEHLSTAGYTVVGGSFEYVASEVCDTTPPPVIVDKPVIFIE